MGTKADSRMAQSVCYLCVHGLRGLVRRDVHHDEDPSLGDEDRKQHFLVATRRQVSGETKTKREGKRWKNRRGREGNEVRECPAPPWMSASQLEGSHYYSRRRVRREEPCAPGCVLAGDLCQRDTCEREGCRVLLPVHPRLLCFLQKRGFASLHCE